MNMDPSWLAALLRFAPFAALTAACGATPLFDGHGRLTALETGGESLPVMVDVRIPLREADTRPGLAAAEEVAVRQVDGVTVRRGVLMPGGGRYVFELRHGGTEDGDPWMEVRVTAEAVAEEIDGIFLEIDVPVEAFMGGVAEAYRGGAPVDEGWTPFPRSMPETDHPHTRSRQWMLLRDYATDRLVLTDAAERRVLEADLDRRIAVFVEDMRQAGQAVYSCRLLLAPHLAVGESTSLRLALRARHQPPRERVHLVVDSATVRYRFDGAGGNYCFGTRSPDTDYTLAHLRSGWARTEMKLQQWVPEEGRVTPENVDWDYLKAQDQPGSEMRREFELMQTLQQRGVPFVVSVWHLPEWLYEGDEILGRGAHQRRVHPEKWPVLLEVIASYLTYARETYGAEPALFSFNEPNAGVRVLFTPEEHRDQIRTLGTFLEARGLRTRMLLGDVIHVGAHAYVEPAMADPEAMRHVGGIAFHSWGRINRTAYENWAALASKLELPLLVAEKGADANAWRDRSFRTFAYALLELRTYMELLLHAKPQGIMYWEFTRDYSLLETRHDDQGNAELVPTPRFHFTRHFTNLTPQPADALATRSDLPSVLFTAYSGIGDEANHLVLHVANLGATTRSARITGIPDAFSTLHVLVSGENEGLAERHPVAVNNGTAELSLPGESLTTLLGER